jgi:hypothetical protein
MQIEQASYVVIQPELTAGETVLWAGQPDPSVRLHREDVFLIPFSLFWGGFSIFWELGVAGYWGSGSNAGKQWFFGMIWGIPFVLIGQYLIWGRFLVAAWKKRRTYYAVTTRRVIVVQNGWSRRMASAYIDTLPTLIKEGGRKGLGSLLFTQPQPLWSRRSSWGGWAAWDGMSVGDVPEFRDIKDVDSVYRLISEHRESLRHVAH